MARESSGSASDSTSSWSDTEKISLLLQIIQNSNITPQWQSLHVPGGRSLLSAQSEYLKMTQSPLHKPTHINNLLSSDNDALRNAVQSTSIQSRSDTTSSNGSENDDEDDHGMAGNMNYNISSPSTSAAGISTVIAAVANAAASGSPGLKRKRGRPTKAESEARKAAIARGELPPPKPPSYTPVATPVYTVGPDGVQRRRRGRPSKAEVEARKAAEAAGLIPPQPPKKPKTQISDAS